MSVALLSSFDSEERALVIGSWLTYGAYYLGRINISPAFAPIAATLSLSLGEVGWLGSVFFWSYALGQVVMGQLGNLIRPRWMVSIGLLLIATTNLIFAMQNSLVPMLALWALNGFAQATGWGPILRILNTRFNTQQRRLLATPFAICFQVGTTASWSISLLLMALGTEWRALFWLPGILLYIVAFIWWQSGWDASPEPKLGGSTKKRELSHWPAIAQELKSWWPYLIIAACTGFVYLGFFLWLPTLSAAIAPLPANLARVQTALLPLLGIPGMLLAGRLLARAQNTLMAMRIFQLLTVVSMLGGALVSGWLRVFATLIAVMTVSGLASLTLSALPLLLAPTGRVSSAGGWLTAVWSLGGGTSGAIIGQFADTSRWSQMFAVWASSMIFALLLLELTSRRRRQ